MAFNTGITVGAEIAIGLLASKTVYLAGKGIINFAAKGIKLLTMEKQVIKLESKIQKQMSARGWTEKSINNTIKNGKAEVAVYTRFNPDTGTRNNAPATKYTNSDGSYVVRNNETNEIVQISNTKNHNWIPHGTK